MDRRVTLLSMALPPLIFGGFILGWILRGSAVAGPVEIGDRVREAAGIVKERYYGTATDEQLAKGAVSGLMATLDPYSEYFTREQFDDFRERTISGKFGGVGVVVEMDRESGYLSVVTPIEDSPAFAADIIPGDKILRVNGEDVRGQAQDEIVHKIKGTEGTKVTLTMYRAGRDPFDVTLTRAKITMVAVKSKMVEDGVGYIRVSDFTEMLPQFDEAVADLRSRGMKALVIDMRFNGGGLMDSAVDLSDRFLPQGLLVVTTRGRTPGDVTERFAKDDTHDVPASMPVAILVNGASASATEVFAGCLKDHDRATLVGARTYGKGSVQTPFALSDGSRLKLTTAHYFTPDGTSVHREEGRKEYGLDPQHLVELSVDEYMAIRESWRQEGILKGSGEKPKPAKDLQLEAGVEVVKAKLEKREPRVPKRELAVKKGD
jgi:carboxyl-terminal processing protease